MYIITVILIEINSERPHGVENMTYVTMSPYGFMLKCLNCNAHKWRTLVFSMQKQNYWSPLFENEHKNIPSC